MTNISRDNINGLLANAETDGIRKAIAKLTSTMNSNVNHARLHNVNGASDHTGVSGAAENHLVAFDANGLFKDSGLTTSTSHNRDHGIDDVLDHNGVSGATTDNLIKFNSNGLPADSGKAYTLVHTQHTDTGTTSTTFVVNSGSGTAKVTIDPTSYSSPYTINKTKTDAWDAGGHTQNTDTGTTSNTFVVNSDGGEAKVTIDPTGYSTAYTINKAKTDAWDSAGHTQNTDTGTTSNTFIINSDGGEAKLTLDPTGYSTAYTINKAKTDTWDSAGHTQNTDTGTSAGTFTINDLSVNETISTPAATNLVLDPGTSGIVNIVAGTTTDSLTKLTGTASGISAWGFDDECIYTGLNGHNASYSSAVTIATNNILSHIGFRSYLTVTGVTLTTRYGLYVMDALGTGSLTNQYGIYIASLTKGSSINQAICMVSGGTIGTTSSGNIALTPNGTGEVDISKVDIDAGTIDGATIATSNITVGAGKTLDVSAGTLTLAADQISGDKVEGGTINAITINTATVGNTGLVVGTSTPFSDSTGALTLQNVDALDATTEGTIESAIDTLANLTSIGSSTGLIKVTTGTLSYITDNSSGWDAAASASHTQNTDTGTTSNTFIVNSDGGEAKLTLDPTSYVTAYTINKAKTDAWDSAGHTQNTDTGTTSNTFVVNSDGGEAKLTLDPTSYTSAYTINKTKTDAWDAASGGGANVTLSNLTDGAVVCNTTLKSDTTNTDDIGSTDIRWKDGYFAGALYIASMGGNWTNAGRTVADGGAFTTIDINGGTVDSITSLTVANDVDIGSFGLRASSLTADELTSGRLTTISTNGLLTSATVTESSGALGGITTLSMSGVLTNTKTDGTAPFTITSTTKVSNLNVDRVDDTHIGTLTNTRLIRYNSTGTTLENATVTESSGALASITTISMSNQLTSSLATGTMPLNVTSTTKCTNLNVDYLDGYHAATLTNGTLLRYNSTGTQIESGTVTESSGALEGITTLSMSGDLTMTGATVNLTHSGATSLTITSTSGTVAVEGVIHNSNTITAANATNIIIDPATTGYINLVQGGATNSVVLDGTNSVASGIGLYVNGTFSGGTSPAAISLNNTVSASATNFYDLKIATVESSGTITSRYGVYLGNPTGAGAVTNCYGLYIESQAKGGTLNYDLYFSATGNISAATGVLTLQTLANNSNINLTTQGTGKVVTNIGINPDADDGAYLGQAGTAWSDLFLATGGVINWNSGNVTLTHAAGVLTLSAGTQFKVDHISESTGSHSIVLDTNWTAASRTCADLGTVTTGIFTSLTGGSIVSASNGTITMQPNGTGQSLIYALSRPYTYYSSGPQTLTIALAGLIVCDGTFTVNLPDATTVDANTSIGYIIKNINTGTITIDPNGSQTIDGSATSVTLDAQWETIALVSYNGNWLKMTSN